MKRKVALDLVGALVVTVAHRAALGWSGWTTTALLAVTVFVAFVAMDGITWAWAKSGRRGDGTVVVAALLVLAIIAGLPVTMWLSIPSCSGVQNTIVVALLFAGFGGLASIGILLRC